MIESNIKEVKVNSPDYKNVESDKAINDFLERIHFYEMQYEPIDEKIDKHHSFIKSKVTLVSIRNKRMPFNIYFFFLSLSKSLQRWREVFGQPCYWSHTITRCLFSNEHTSLATNYLFDKSKIRIFLKLFTKNRLN